MLRHLIRTRSKSKIGVAALAALAAFGNRPALGDEASAPPLTPMEDLGRKLFNDTDLSISRTQACSSCHEEDRAFTGNNAEDDLFPVAVGALPTLFGIRNSPTVKYAAFIPPFSFVEDEGDRVPVGGQFLDGRADTLAAQAAQPFINPREMAMPNEAAVVERIAGAEYAEQFQAVFGEDVFLDSGAAYAAMTRAIEAFEQTQLFSPFTSKFDAVLRGAAQFTPEEERGFGLFKAPDKGNCIGCHVGDEASTAPQDWLFTDFTYDNLGVPRNPEIPDNADPSHVDLGLCSQPELLSRVPDDVEDKGGLVAGLCGAFKVPTLRNVAQTAPYMHNGVFKSLREVVDFYVTRDTQPERWYPTLDGKVEKFNDLPAEFHANVNTSEVPYDRAPGDEPHLSSLEIDDVVAFLGTLSDGYTP